MFKLKDIPKIELTQSDMNQVRFCLEYHSEFDGIDYTCELNVEKRKKVLYEQWFKELGLRFVQIWEGCTLTTYKVRWKND